MKFDEIEALKCLEEDRRSYIKRAVEYIQGFLDRGMDEMAETALITAGQELQRLNGSIEYVKQLAKFNSDGYPRFGPIFE